MLTWPRRSMVVPRGSFAGGLARLIFSTAEPTPPRSRPVHVGVHVEDRLHVVVIDDFGSHAARHHGQIGEQLRSASGRARIAVGQRMPGWARHRCRRSPHWPHRPAKSPWWC